MDVLLCLYLLGFIPYFIILFIHLRNEVEHSCIDDVIPEVVMLLGLSLFHPVMSFVLLRMIKSKL